MLFAFIPRQKHLENNTTQIEETSGGGFGLMISTGNTKTMVIEKTKQRDPINSYNPVRS